MLSVGKERILIIAPHADDEVLGCGGLIEKACRLKNKVKVVVVTVGDIQHKHQKNIITGEVRKKELAEAMHYLGCDDFEIIYDDKDSLLDAVPKKELVGQFDKIIDQFNPTMVFIPLPSYHQDHEAVNKACISSLRPNKDKKIKLIALYEYPLIDWQLFKFWHIGGLYLDISDTVHKKVEALKKHQSQIRPSGHLISPESVLKWAEHRGMEAGYTYAEKYYIIRLADF
ncbi:PIG-L deacetylase family protein [Virgibacillus sp. W0430]|uniref:PIG-L deacetylase family protein n=1 Tax=Virgibacillus sp. W0430 TaxID=3391580 RepID=UPI003F457089